MAPKTLKSILFIVNSNDRLTDEFVGHASTP